MTRTLLPLQRVRLELDRTLRTRSFFVRAIRGDLELPAYCDLVVQLSLLVACLHAEQGHALTGRAMLDVETLERCATVRRKGPCFAVEHFREAVRSYVRCLAPDVAYDTGLAVFGTSWARAAAGRLGRRMLRATSFLRELSDSGPASLARIAPRIEAGDIDVEHVHAFAELSRGALLGLVTYFDAQWPAPIVSAGTTLVLPPAAARPGEQRPHATKQ